jgi:hypothetical protein
MQRNSERGALLVHIALSLLVFMGFIAYALDYGVFWLARRQAQNAADGGALAGATALAYDSWADRSTGGLAHQSAVQTATLNPVFGEVAGVIADQAENPADWATAVNPPSTCVDAPGTCVNVDVFRDGTAGSSPLPTFFANIWGISQQNVRATATAQVRSANATKCMKPWMIADKGETATETYTLADIGTFLVARDQTGPSQYQQADFDTFCRAYGVGGGAACYRWSITHCIGVDPNAPLDYGDDIGNKTGRTQGGQAQKTVFDQDPDAYWDFATKSVRGSCAETRTCSCANTVDGCANGMGGIISPRILAVGVFAPSALQQGPGQWDAQLKNVIGMFMLEPGVGDPRNADNARCIQDAKNVCGYLTTTPGEFTSGGGSPAQGSTLNVLISLVR